MNTPREDTPALRTSREARRNAYTRTTTQDRHSVSLPHSESFVGSERGLLPTPPTQQSRQQIMTTSPTQHRTAHECISAETRHTFDEISGWCLKGCGNRDDGRVTSRFGDVLAAGDESRRNTQDGMPLWA